MTTLADLKPNEVATVTRIIGDDPIATRIMEMGILEGEPITLLGVAPFGDPMEFLVRGYRLSLRVSEAERVEVNRTT